MSKSKKADAKAAKAVAPVAPPRKVDPRDLLKFVLHNQTADVRAALQKGADANLIDRDGISVLMHACIHGRLEIMKALMDHGADRNMQDQEGFTALIHAVCKNQHASVVTLMSHPLHLNPDESVAPVAEPAQNEEEGKEKKKDKKKDKKKAENAAPKPLVDPDLGDKRGYTALMWACILNRHDMIEQLLLPAAAQSADDDHGSDSTTVAPIQGAAIDVADKDGNTALCHASLHCDVAAVDRLLKHNPQPNVGLKNKAGQMAYDLVGQIFVPQEASSSGQMPKLRQLRPDQTTEIEKMLKAALLYQLRLAELNTKSSCVMQ